MNAPIRSIYLANGEYEESAYDEEVSRRVDELMKQGAKCDPLEPPNFDEALSETMAGLPSSQIAHTIAIALREGSPVNQLLIDMANAYWRNRAIDEAKEDMFDDHERAAEDRAESRHYWLTH